MLKKSGHSSQGISESEINDMRLKYSKESAQGEILKICRDFMTESTFDSILPGLLSFLRGSHDITTKASAVSFISDIIVEGKQNIIAPKNSRKICQWLV